MLSVPSVTYCCFIVRHVLPNLANKLRHWCMRSVTHGVGLVSRGGVSRPDSPVVQCTVMVGLANKASIFRRRCRPVRRLRDIAGGLTSPCVCRLWVVSWATVFRSRGRHRSKTTQADGLSSETIDGPAASVRCRGFAARVVLGPPPANGTHEQPASILYAPLDAQL